MKIGDYYNLKENEKNIVSKKEENGYDDQYLKKEEIRWVVLDIDEEKGTALLISDKPTKQKVFLQGQARPRKRNRHTKQIMQRDKRSRRSKKSY